MSVPVSIIILTYNEEADLPGCLDALQGLGDVHVVDSGSTDSTAMLVSRHGATLWVNPFASFGQQRNWALDHVHFQGQWVLFVDADERITPVFWEGLQRAVREASSEVAGFYCCWKLMLDGRWLRRCDVFPRWQFRLLRSGRARFRDFGHGQKEDKVSGRIEYLAEPYLHFAFSRGWEHWTKKHEQYAKQEAEARLYGKWTWQDLFSPHSSIRNPALKMTLGQSVWWPWIRFAHTYGLRGGFLEGVLGWTYCMKMLWYERRIQFYIRQKRNQL
jgi:glycosyltransferase involved in cell wall biosynthesis